MTPERCDLSHADWRFDRAVESRQEGRPDERLRVPEVFLLFWVVKLLTTGIGEAGADFLGIVSIPLAAVVGIVGFFVALWLQLQAGPPTLSATG